MIKDENVKYFCHATPEGRDVCLVNPITADLLGPALVAVVDLSAKDGETDYGYFIEYLIDEETGRAKCTEWKSNGSGGMVRHMIMCRNDVDFDVINRQTGEVLARHRQTSVSGVV